MAVLVRVAVFGIVAGQITWRETLRNVFAFALLRCARIYGMKIRDENLRGVNR